MLVCVCVFSFHLNWSLVSGIGSSSTYLSRVSLVIMSNGTCPNCKGGLLQQDYLRRCSGCSVKFHSCMVFDLCHSCLSKAFPFQSVSTEQDFHDAVGIHTDHQFSFSHIDDGQNYLISDDQKSSSYFQIDDFHNVSKNGFNVFHLNSHNLSKNFDCIKD